MFVCESVFGQQSSIPVLSSPKQPAPAASASPDGLSLSLSGPKTAICLQTDQTNRFRGLLMPECMCAF
jgi:hypothetical protein